MTPYEFVYDQKPLLVTSYLIDISKFQEMDHTLDTREAIISIPKDNFIMAQNRMKQQAYQHRYEHYFTKGDQCFFTFNPINKNRSKTKHTIN
jgi:hypothetical protein